MNPLDAFQRILASLHQAAVGDAHWLAAAALIADTLGAVGHALVVGRGEDDDVPIHFAHYLYGGEPRQDLLRDYFDVYYPQDTGMRRLIGRPNDQLVHVPDLYPGDELKTSPVYNDFLRRVGGQEGLYLRFRDANGLRLVWGIADTRASAGWHSDQLALIDHLWPHIRHFVIVRDALAGAEALGASLSGLLDNGGIGVLQLERDGRVVAANDLALAVLRSGEALFDDRGTLRATLPADNSRLRVLLRRALPGPGSETPSGGSMTVQRPLGQPRLELHVHPVGGGQADFEERPGAAVVLVVDPASRRPIDPRRVSTMLGLTPSEGRVAALLAEGKPPKEIAAAAGYQESYVYWLLKQIYRKQRLSGQIALVQRVLAACSLPRP